MWFSDRGGEGLDSVQLRSGADALVGFRSIRFGPSVLDRDLARFSPSLLDFIHFISGEENLDWGSVDGGGCRLFDFLLAQEISRFSFRGTTVSGHQRTVRSQRQLRAGQRLSLSAMDPSGP